jgi:hypothetical protein
MGSYFDSLKEELKSIRATQEFVLVQLGIEPTKPDVASDDNEKIKQSSQYLNPPIISSKRRYYSEDIEKYLNEESLDSNKRFLPNE